MAEPEKVKVILDISDVLVKRTAEVRAAEQAEKAKIASAKREAAAIAKEDKAAFDHAVRLAKQEEAEREAAAKRIAAEEARIARQVAAEKAKEDKAAFEYAVKLARDEAAEKERLAKKQAAYRESQFAVHLDEGTEAVKSQRVNIEALRGRINLLGEGLGKAGSAAAAMGPQFGALSQGMQKAGGAASALLTSVSAFGGPVGIALGVSLAAATAAWGAHAERVEKNKKAMEDARAEAEKTSATFNQLADDLFEATLQQKVLNGTMTQAEADMQRAAHGINQAYGPALEGAVGKIDELNAAISAQQKIIDDAGKSMNNFGGMGSNAGKKIAAAKAEQERLTGELGRAEEAYDRLQSSMNTLTDAQTSNIATTAQQTAARRDNTAATKEAAEAERLAAEAAAQRTSEAEYNYQVFLRDEQAAADARKQAYEDTKWLEEQKREQFAATREAGQKAAEEAKRAREEDFNAAQQYLDGISSIAGSANDIVDLVYDKRVSATEDLYDRYEQALEDGDEATAKSLKKQYEAEKEGALKAFKVNKSLAVTSATLSTVVAVAKALEAGWPAALVTVPAAAAAGAAQIAAAAMQEPPEFDDTPQVMRAEGSGRSTAEFRGGDFVAAAQTVDGLRNQVDRLEGGGGRREIVTERMNRTMAGRTVTRDVQTVTRGIWRSA